MVFLIFEFWICAWMRFLHCLTPEVFRMFPEYCQFNLPNIFAFSLLEVYFRENGVIPIFHDADFVTRMPSILDAYDLFS